MTVAYDGTDFAGFQIQPGQRTVQGTLETAIFEVTGEASRVEGAGRTDAGVHATGQVVSFQTKSNLAVARLQIALNARLPADVAVHNVIKATEGFRARQWARGREYQYTIWNGPARLVIGRAYSNHWRAPLDVPSMDEGIHHLVGTHDFAAFATTGGGRDHPASTVRRVDTARCWREGDWVYVTMTATAFLPHMVRNVVGTLVDVGMNRTPPSAMTQILASRDRRLAGRMAPARGLCLVRVSYDEET